MPDPVPSAPPRGFVRRWTRRLAVVGVLLLVLAYFAPTLAVKLGLVSVVAARASADLNGTVTVGGASLGWFSPVELRDVTLTDANGRTVLAAPRVVSSKWLLSLARSKSDFGTFTVEGPQIEVVCEGPVTNLERVVEKYLNDPAPSTGTRPAVAVRVTDGQLTVTDADNGKSWTFTGVDAAAAVPASDAEPVAVKVTTKAGAGSVDADVALGTGIEVKLKADGFPVAAAVPFARRAHAGLAASGRLSADLAATITNGGAVPAVKAAGTVAVADFELTSPLLPEPVKLAAVELPCTVETADGVVKVERAEVKCEIGTASFAGTLDLGLPVARWAERPGLTAAADVDLAKAAAAFPKLLRLRPGTAVTDGRVKLELASKPADGGVRWEGSVTTSALRGTRDGRPLAWEQPLEAAFAARLAPDRPPVFDRLGLKAEFATVTASGAADRFTIAADVSLDKLAARLGEFADLGGLKLAGTAKLQVAAAPNEKGETAVTGRADLANFELADGTRALSEPQLAATFTLDGKFDPREVMKLDGGRVTVTAGQDTLDVALAEPVPDLRALAAGKATATLSGDFARWRARADRLVPIPKTYLIGGTGKVTGVVRFDADRITADGTTADVTNLRFHGAGVKLDEPQFKLYPTTFVLDRRTGAVEAPVLTAACQTAGVGAERVRLALNPDGSYGLSLAARAKANLLRVQQLLQLQSDPALADALSGTVSDGTLTLDGSGNVYRFKANLPIQEFAYGRPQQPTWAEPSLTIVAEGEYDLATDALKLTAARVQRPDGLAADAAGTVGHLTTTTDLDLAGKLTYDLATVEPQLRKLLGPGVKAVGKDTREFRLAGSLYAPGGPVTLVAAPAPAAPGMTFTHLNGNAALAWQSLRAYGFDVGQAEMRATLSGGVLKANPLEAAFGETGKVRVEPTVRLDTPTYEMTLAPGRIVDRAKLTPAACADALGYALPAIARSSATEGTVSFELEQNNIPLADPTAGTVRGKLTLHQVQVGPGPLITEIAHVFGAPQTRVTLANEQVVPVRLEKGRVYHENLRLTANGFSVTTTGSVGLDGSLQLNAELPVPESAVGPLLRGTPKLREAVAAKRITVPVGGTVTAPRLDRAAFQAAVQKFVKEAGGEAAKGKLNEVIDQNKDKLRGEIEKGLGRFLPAQPQPKKP
jgi:hypothetical protein